MLEPIDGKELPLWAVASIIASVTSSLLASLPADVRDVVWADVRDGVTGLFEPRGVSQ
jgi:hypothetical protein